jgi:hypothetical protein
MKPGDRKRFLGFTLVASEEDQVMYSGTYIIVQNRKGEDLHESTYLGVGGAKLWCVLHFWRA